MPYTCTIVDPDEDGNLPPPEEAEACGLETKPSRIPMFDGHEVCPEHGRVPRAICTEVES